MNGATRGAGHQPNDHDRSGPEDGDRARVLADLETRRTGLASMLTLMFAEETISQHRLRGIRSELRQKLEDYQAAVTGCGSGATPSRAAATADPDEPTGHAPLIADEVLLLTDEYRGHLLARLLRVNATLGALGELLDGLENPG